jgi:hypothetical protein
MKLLIIIFSSSCYFLFHHHHHHHHHHHEHCKVRSLRPVPMNRKMVLVSPSFRTHLRSVTLPTVNFPNDFCTFVGIIVPLQLYL